VNKSLAGPAKACQTWRLRPRNKDGSTPRVGSGVGEEVGVGEETGEDMDEGVVKGVSTGSGLGARLSVGRSRLAVGTGDTGTQAEAISAANKDRASRRVNRMIC
jgi:hypothetical protein